MADLLASKEVARARGLPFVLAASSGNEKVIAAGQAKKNLGAEMRRYICQQNIAHFEGLLSKAAEPALRRTLQSLLASAKRELALLDSSTEGADGSPHERQRRQRFDANAVRLEFQPKFDSSPHPYMLLDPGPGLRIVDINDAYAKATFTAREDVVGKSLFDVFPDNPEDELADGVSNLFSSLKIVTQTGSPHAMAVQRYDIRDTNGEFVARYWQPINTPIHDKDGHLIFLLHHVEDVTDLVLPKIRTA